MEQFLPAIFISAIIAFIMYKQIQQVAKRLDVDGEKNNFEKYASFSAHIQEYIRDIKKDINSSDENRIFKLQDENKLDEASEKLSDFLRKLVFFETLMAKKKSKQEIEADLAQILFDLDRFVREYIKDGEIIAEKMREDLQNRFEKL